MTTMATSRPPPTTDPPAIPPFCEEDNLVLPDTTSVIDEGPGALPVVEREAPVELRGAGKP